MTTTSDTTNGETPAMEPATTWNALLLEQLTWHWENHLRPGLDGLTDDEYFWEPVEGCWSLRPRGESVSPMAAGGGDHVLDWAWPEPDPAPVTTIAWRLGHVLIGVFGARNANHFGGPPADYLTYVMPTTATDALAAMDEAYRVWVEGVQGLGQDGLFRAVGEVEGPFAAFSYASLVLHIHREVLHHGAEILLLRDLYRSKR